MTDPAESAPAAHRRERRRRREPALLDLARAVVLGIRDTGRDMLEAGRTEARKAQDESWRRFDELTHKRRER